MAGGSAGRKSRRVPRDNHPRAPDVEDGRDLVAHHFDENRRRRQHRWHAEVTDRSGAQLALGQRQQPQRFDRVFLARPHDAGPRLTELPTSTRIPERSGAYAAAAIDSTASVTLSGIGVQSVARPTMTASSLSPEGTITTSTAEASGLSRTMRIASRSASRPSLRLTGTPP